MIQKIKECIASDSVSKSLVKFIEEGWPMTRQMCPESIRPYWTEKTDIIYIDGLIFRGEQIIIPKRGKKW